MEAQEVQFQRPMSEWITSVSMIIAPLPVFWFFYPRSGFENGNKGMIYLLCLALFLFIYGFYKAFLIPCALQIQENGSLMIKSVLFPKPVAAGEIESVRLTDSVGKKGATRTNYEIILKDGESFAIPSLTHMRDFIEKLKALYPQIGIKDERSDKEKY
jgi:hypothetical protein